MDKNGLLYFQSACALKLPVALFDQVEGFEIKLARRRYFFRGCETPFNCGSSISIAVNKFCMNKTLEEAGFPVPKAYAYNEEEYKSSSMADLISYVGFPLVVKPTIGTALGEDVVCNITSMAQLTHHMEACLKDHEYVSVEAFHGGMNSYRVLVFYNQVIGVVQRFSARVVGDGIHSIRDLIAMENVTRETWKKTVSLGEIKVDAEYLIRLSEQGMTLDTVPKNKETVILCYTCNSSRGGSMHSMGKKICPENARMLCRAAVALDLNLVGFDVQCEDILIPMKGSRGVIIEANHNPDISIHESAMSGTPNQVSKKILRRLILRHPIAYCKGFLQHKRYGLYLKTALIASVMLVWKYQL